MNLEDGSRSASGRQAPAHARVAVVGGGPAGLMAAEALQAAGAEVDLYDAMPSVGRKFLLAGRGGLNLTHTEPQAPFLDRYGDARASLQPLIDGFGPAALVDWVHRLGVDTFVGSSGRVFPEGMKAAPLLRAWLHRLRASGVRFHMRHRWRGWRGQSLMFETADGQVEVRADATVLALGGASWSRLGSDGRWAALLEARGVPVVPLRPSNCGFEAGWSAHFAQRFAGHPLKSVEIGFEHAGREHRRRGEFVVADYGIEGSLVYAFSSMLRDAIAERGEAILRIDLAPDRREARLAEALARPRGGRSLSNHLRVAAGLQGVKAALLREVLGAALPVDDAPRLAAAIKRLPLRLLAARPIDEAISSAGGVRFDVLDEHLMLVDLPGVFCAGEMLDWEAPTGGYLLTACFATGLAAGRGAARWLARERGQPMINPTGGNALQR